MHVTAERDWRTVKAVLLNGVELKNCVEADDVEGYAIVIRSDSDGKVIPCQECGSLVSEARTGKVEIVFNESDGNDETANPVAHAAAQE